LENSGDANRANNGRIQPRAFKALQLPKFGVKAAVLVQDATAMAEAARAYEEVFVGNGRPENFVDALLAAATAVRASIDARARVSRVGRRRGTDSKPPQRERTS